MSYSDSLGTGHVFCIDLSEMNVRKQFRQVLECRVDLSRESLIVSDDWGRVLVEDHQSGIRFRAKAYKVTGTLTGETFQRKTLNNRYRFASFGIQQGQNGSALSLDHTIVALLAPSWFMISPPTPPSVPFRPF